MCLDKELHDLTKLASFWGMYPVGMYELRYVFIQLKGTPLFVGEGRIPCQYPRWYFMIGNQFIGREAQTHLIVGPDYSTPPRVGEA